MPVPTSYTDADLRAFMLTALSRLNDSLGWTSASLEVVEAGQDALFAYGVTDVSGATDLRKLRAFARLTILTAAALALSALYDFDTDGQSFKRSQVAKALAGAQGMLALARAEVATFSGDVLGAFEILPYGEPGDVALVGA